MKEGPGAPRCGARTQRDELLLELVELHARMLTRMPWVHLPFVGGMAVFLLPLVPPSTFAGWALWIMSVEIGRAALGRHWLRHIATLDFVRTHRCQVLMAAVSGLSMGMLAVLFLPLLSLEEQSMITFVLAGVPGVGVAVSMSSRAIAGVYAMSVLVPTGVMWVRLHPQHLVVVVVMEAIYMAVLVLATIESEHMLTRSVGVRRQRDEVVRELESSNVEVREAVARAEREAAARSRVLAAASHDLRQPLHALSIYSAILAANPAPLTLREVGTHIDQIVRSLGALLHGLLDLSQLSSGHYVPVRHAFAADKLLATICAEFESVAAAKALALRIELAPLMLVGDAMAVSRIARNLLDNAVKYTERGSVSLRLELDGQWARLTVADTGKGIAQAEQVRVFEEFYQLENPGRDRAKGVGLGLAIVQRLAALIGASITLHSEPGQGTRFEVRLPGASATQPTASLQPPVMPIAYAGLRRIYLVDDEQDILRSMTALLSLWGFEVHTAHNAAEAMALFGRHGRPDLLIADLHLGDGEHGGMLANRMHELHGRFAVLIATGETSSDAVRQANAAGFTLLHKPIEAELLSAAIQQLVVSARG